MFLISRKVAFYPKSSNNQIPSNNRDRPLSRAIAPFYVSRHMLLLLLQNCVIFRQLFKNRDLLRFVKILRGGGVTLIYS